MKARLKWKLCLKNIKKYEETKMNSDYLFEVAKFKETDLRSTFIKNKQELI